MRILLFSLFLSIGLSGCTDPVIELDEGAAIREIMQSQEQAWNRGDLEAFMQAYWNSPELKFVGKSGIKKGWQTTLKNYQTSYPNKAMMGKLKFDILQVEAKAETAFVLGRWTLQRAEDKPSGFYSLYWKKINGNWKIVIDHSS